MTRKRSFVRNLFAAGGVVVCGATLLGGGTYAVLTHNFCSDDLLREERSPDGAYAAAVFERNCGATTPFVYHVNLRSVSQAFRRDWFGTIKDGEIVTSARDPLTFDWSGSRELHLYGGSQTSQPQRWRDVHVSREIRSQ